MMIRCSQWLNSNRNLSHAASGRRHWLRHSSSFTTQFIKRGFIGVFLSHLSKSSGKETWSECVDLCECFLILACACGCVSLPARNVNETLSPWAQIVSLHMSLRSMWETTVMHKQVSGWTVNFGPNFPVHKFTPEYPPPPENWNLGRSWHFVTFQFRNTPPPRKLKFRQILALCDFSVSE